jgi:hypothetical protein
VVYDVRTAKVALEVAARGARMVETSVIREMLRESRKAAQMSGGSPTDSPQQPV